MNTNKLKSFAQIARRILMEGVSRRITYYGFDAKGKVIEEPIPVTGGVIIREEILDDATIPAKWQALRAAIQRHGVESVVEEASYTWFNRLMAMQILAKNNYDPTQLEYESAGSVTPVIQARARRGMISYLDRTEQKRVQPLLGDYQNEQKAFAILLTGYCHHHQLLNRIFGRLDDYTELLLPDNILAESGFIHLLNTTDAITDEDYRQVELIGWLYQFYISEKKDQVFASFKKNKKAEAEDIPAATQIFTPNWIVKYMVQNTVGRIWLDHHPTSPLRQKMKYLVEAPNENETQSPISFNGLEGGLKLLDPACGSGHILVEGFFHLYDIYEEEYYMPAEAAEKILQHNLFGLDIDLRAAQLAQFAVLLAAATKYPDILKKEITPHIYAMPETAEFSREEILDFLGSEGIQHEKVLAHALELMQQAKNLGSIMQFNITPVERQFFIHLLETLQTEAKTNLLAQSLLNKIHPFLQVLIVMTGLYESVIANPPYLNQKNFNKELKSYVETNFSLSKSDLFSIFMDVCIRLTSIYGKMSMINQHAWMFLFSFENLRKKFLSEYYLENMIHLGKRTFEEIKGEKVQSTAFVFSKKNPKEFGSTFIRLVDGINVKEKEKLFLSKKNIYKNISQLTFNRIPGDPLAYWANELDFSLFNEKLLSDISPVRKGIDTGKNDQFLRSWHEISYNKFSSFNHSRKWYIYIKGGEFKKWYGNLDLVVNWENDGYEIHNHKGSTIRNIKFIKKEAITWSLTGSNFSPRYIPKNCIFDNNGSSVFPEQVILYKLVGLLISKIASKSLSLLNPTLAFQVGDIARIPVKKIFSNTSIDALSICSISITSSDYNSSETSWEFVRSPLLKSDGLIDSSYQEWVVKTTSEFYQLHANEEELNRILIDIYSINEGLDPIVQLKDITVLQNELDRNTLQATDKELRKHRQWKMEQSKWQLYIDGQLQPISEEGILPQSTVQPSLPIKKNVVMQQLISYAIGCMMGRYSLDAPGLILANQGETIEDYFEKVGRRKSEDRSQESEEGRFLPDDDGIVPMMGSNCGFSDDAVLRLRQFIEAVWGSETLTQNINFLQSCLDMEIEKYLVAQTNFWKDHCSRYKKKPIYWLFSSKKGAFQVLVYMHRMNRFTVQRIRESYMFKHLQWLTNQKAELERRSATLSRDETRQLDTYRTALTECQEYDLQLKNIADQQIEFDLDDGVSVNYEKFEPLLAGIK